MKKLGLNDEINKIDNVIKMYLDYITNNSFYNKKHYSIPNFGSQEIWIDFLNGLYYLYHYEDNELYLKTYKVLMSS